MIGASTERKIFAEGGPRVIGWREWVALPELGVGRVKAKIDTGAKTSSLHAYELAHFRRRRADWVRFVVHPMQRDTNVGVECEAKVVDQRIVTSSSGHAEDRPVIVTNVRLGPDEWEIELTLTNRDTLGFRMLLGRSAIKEAFLIDPARSYIRGKRPKRS